MASTHVSGIRAWTMKEEEEFFGFNSWKVFFFLNRWSIPSGSLDPSDPLFADLKHELFSSLLISLRTLLENLFFLYFASRCMLTRWHEFILLSLAYISCGMLSHSMYARVLLRIVSVALLERASCFINQKKSDHKWLRLWFTFHRSEMGTRLSRTTRKHVA